MYYVVLALYVVIIFSRQSADFVERQEKMIEFLPYYLFYMNELVVDGATGFAHSWSLAIEEKFYVIWPALGFVLLAGCGARPRILVVVLSSCVLFLMSATQDYTGLDYYYLSYWMLLAGCLLALLLESRTSFERIRALLGKGGSYVVISLFLLIHFTKADIPLLFHIYPLAVAALIAVIVMGNTGLTDFLERRPLKALGVLSYGIYLIHVLATNAVKLVIAPEPGAFIENMLAFLGSIALSAALAYGLYLTVERPCIAYGKRLSNTVSLRGRTPATT
jgi:peptidoglycan/LPS O-acetylase OafA/YrhL